MKIFLFLMVENHRMSSASPQEVEITPFLDFLRAGNMWQGLKTIPPSEWDDHFVVTYEFDEMRDISAPSTFARFLVPKRATNRTNLQLPAASCGSRLAWHCTEVDDGC